MAAIRITYGEFRIIIDLLYHEETKRKLTLWNVSQQVINIF